jgi:transposase InsO family protein
VPTGVDTPQATAASSLESPSATLRQKRCWTSRWLTAGRPGDRIRGRSARSAGRDFGFATTHSRTLGVLRRPLDFAQYTAIRFTQRLADAGIQPSMGSVGDSFDNALAESFFSTLKVERVYRTTYRTREEAELDLFRYIDGWYNPHRIQRELGWQSPDEYEEAYYHRESSGTLASPAGAR